MPPKPWAWMGAFLRSQSLVVPPSSTPKTDSLIVDKKGNVTIIFALASIVITASIGMAVDLARVDQVKKQLQNAADAAVLKAIKLKNTTQSERLAQARSTFLMNFKSPQGATGITTMLNDEIINGLKQSTFTVNAKLPSYFGVNQQTDEFDISVQSSATTANLKTEIALVLDITGSMNSDGRLTYLKSAVDGLLQSLTNEDIEIENRAKVALIPFNTQTRLSPARGLGTINYGTTSLVTACASGINSYQCQALWDAYDKLCTTAANMDDCRSKAVGFTRTTTSSGTTTYQVLFRSYQGSSGAYTIFSMSQTLKKTSSSNSLTYVSHSKTQTYTSSLSSLNSVPSGHSTLSSSALKYNIDNSKGYGAAPRKQVASTTYGVQKITVTPAINDTIDQWQGCVSDRDQPYDVSAEAASPLLAQSLYPAMACIQSSTAMMQALSIDYAALRSKVNGLTASGNTNITIGIQWGMEALSPELPLGGGAGFFTPDVKKTMIVVTDGQNTANRWSNQTSIIDARTALACTEAKNKGITVYVLNVVDGNSNLLRNCASSPGHFYDLSQAQGLSAAFADVYLSLSKVRLTK